MTDDIETLASHVGRLSVTTQPYKTQSSIPGESSPAVTPNLVFEDLCKSAGLTYTLATQLEALSRKGQWPPSDAAPLDLFALPQTPNHLIRRCGELERAATVMRNAAVNGTVTQLLRLADDSKDPPDEL
ncbi:hypothetical protein DL770_007794 [Monosporascus sp. CRB-9-2]|nr:hypothetical protein DL770_007794 [Monosporascus sp. CRB-9-2]